MQKDTQKQSAPLKLEMTGFKQLFKLVIWINARNLGISCGDKIPESIQTYIDIMKTHFDIDFEHLLK